MLENYKNILANKFMRDTNYIIIKDTDDLEELQRQWELFETQMTRRQQRLSDDRSIEIWNMTNQEHYESLRDELMSDIDSKYGDSEEDDNESVYYDPEEDEDNFNDDEFDNLIGLDTDNEDIPDDDNNITEPVKEDSVIPIENNNIKISEPKHYNSFLKNSQDIQKDNMADQYEIDTNMHIIGRVTGGNVDDYLNNLEKSFTNFNAQTHDHRKKSDDKCREIYGMSNLERYNKLKADALKFKSVKTIEKVTSTDNETLDSSKVQQLGEFVSQVYDNMQAVNEVENLKVNKHRRFNDTPYFTPSEMIDMGVHGNHNFYCKDADNDGLITNIKIPTWFASYKDMSMDHIFEDYRNDWIDTLDLLYSDFEDIKSSGDEDKILARKQSILDLGWNPEIPFNRKNRLKASKRVSDILDKTIPKDIFINLDNIPESDDDELLSEAANKSTHKPVLLIFTQGHTPIVSQGIKLVTGSSYSHASISFDPELKEVYSFNIREKAGFIKENLDSFKDNIISVMAFFAPTKIVKQLKDKVKDFENNKTTFDLRIFFNKILKIDHKVSKNEYHQVCSTFVDTVLKSGNINLVGDIEIPDPGQLYDHAKAIPNKIIEVFNDVATKYDGKKIKKKINSLLKTGIESIEESITGMNLNDIKNGVNPYSKKRFYHISFDSDLDEHGPLKPRIPTWITNELKKDKNFIQALEKLKLAKDSSGFGFEEYKTPRVCFSNSIEGCLNAIINDTGRLKLAGKTLYVYTPEKPISSYKCKSNKQIIKDGDIFDANITNEMWILEPVQLKYVGSIVVDKVNGEHVRKFANNKKKIIVKYDYKWHWFHKIKNRSVQNEAYKESKNYSNIIQSQVDSIIDDTIYHLKQYTTSSNYRTKYSKYKFFKLINIHKVKYGTYGGVAVVNDSPYQNSSGLYDVDYDLDKIDKNAIDWYNDLLKEGKQYAESKCDKSLLQIIDINTGDGDEGIIYFNKKKNIKPSVTDAVINAIIKADDISEKILNKIPGYEIIRKVNNHNANLKPSEKIACGIGMGLGDGISKAIFKEQTSILNEVKQFPIEFDKDGNLIIYKARTGSLSYGDEIDDSVQLLETYRNQSNIEGIKYELAKLWYINDCIEKNLKKRLKNEQYKELIDTRAVCLNVFKLNLDFVMKAEKGFNFSDYYNSTPFSDSSIKITSNTLKYTMKAIKGLL